jgi:hypothetical protein
MEQIKGIDTNGNYSYEGDGQLDQETQKVINECLFATIGADSDGKLISLNKACEWLEDNYPYWFDTDMEEQFRKAMKDGNKT